MIIKTKKSAEFRGWTAHKTPLFIVYMVFCSRFHFFDKTKYQQNWACLFRKLVSFELVFSVFSRCFILSFCSSFVQMAKFLFLSFIFVSDESVLTAAEYGFVDWHLTARWLWLLLPRRRVPFREYLPKVICVWCVTEVLCLLKAEI